MLSTVRNKDNKANIIYVQGAFSRGTSNDISGVTFQNYDDDSKQTYNIASVTARDAFGSAEANGLGELLFHTNTTGCNLTEKMRIKHSGQICMAGAESFSNALLSVYGTTSITSNLNVFGTTSVSSQSSNTAFIVNQQGNGNIVQLLRSNQPQLTVSTNGYLGIGESKSNPAREITVIELLSTV